MADRAPLAADLFITRVVRTAWVFACLATGQHEQSVRVRRRPVMCAANVTQLDTHPVRMLSNSPRTHTAPEVVGDRPRKLRKGGGGWSSGLRMDRMLVFTG